MAVSLKKGQGVSLRKTGNVDNDLTLVTIGLGWDIATKKRGRLLRSLMGKGDDYDLDAVAFLCGANGKVADLGRNAQGKIALEGGDVIFFNNKMHRSGEIWLTGDNRTGKGDGDDEQIVVKLDQLSSAFSKIVFAVQIYHGIKNNQHFGAVDNAYIRAVDRSGQEMARFDLSGSGSDMHRSLLFAELVRDGGDWRFNAIGKPYEADNFVELLRHYT